MDLRWFDATLEQLLSHLFNHLSTSTEIPCGVRMFCCNCWNVIGDATGEARLEALSALGAGEHDLARARRVGRGRVLAVEAVGWYGTPFTELRNYDSNIVPVGGEYVDDVSPRYFNTRKTTIYGGSSEVQRNVLAKAMLGL